MKTDREKRDLRKRPGRLSIQRRIALIPAMAAALFYAVPRAPAQNAGRQLQVGDNVLNVTSADVEETAPGTLAVQRNTRQVYSVGDVLIGDETQRWARKVTAVGTVNGQTRLTVVDAALSDIMADGSTLGYSITPDWSQAMIVGETSRTLQKPLADYLAKPDSNSRGGRGDGCIDLGNTSLVDLVIDATGHVDWGSSTVMGQVLGEASDQDEAMITSDLLTQGRFRVRLDEGSELQIFSTMDVDHTWSWLHGLTTDVDMDTTVVVDLKVTVSFEGSVSAHVAWPLLPKLSVPITIPTTPPLYLSVELEIPVGVVLNASGALSATFGQRAEYEFDVDMGFRPFGGFFHNESIQKTIHDPVAGSAGLSASVSTEVYMEPTVSVKLYDIVGPLLWTHPYLRREASFSRGISSDKSILGITAGVGLELGNSLLGGTWNVRSDPILDFSRTQDLLGGGTSEGASDSGGNSTPGAVAPSITMARPTSPETADDYVAIWWNDYDPDDNATICLWQDNDNIGYNGTRIASGIEEDWHADRGVFYLPLGGMSEGKQFYVYATISDGLHTAKSTNYTARITVDHPSPGTNAAIEELEWDDDTGSGSGDGDRVMEAGEQVRLQAKLVNNSSSTVENVQALLSTHDPAVQITENAVCYDPIEAGGLQDPVGWFDLGLNFALGAGETRTGQFTLHLTYEENGLKYYQDIDFDWTFREQNDWGAFEVVDSTPSVDDSAAIFWRNVNNNALESGEEIHIRPQIRNNGVATATRVDVQLLYYGNELVVGPSEQRYEDLPPTQAGYPINGRSYRVYAQDYSFTGDVTLDVRITYDEGTTAVLLPDAITLTVHPVPIVAFLDEERRRAWDFGVVAPGEQVTQRCRIFNSGSGVLTVTGIQTSDPANTIAALQTRAFPLDIQPGESIPVDVSIDTTSIRSGSTVSRTVKVLSNGRLEDNAPPTDTFEITGLVSDPTPILEVPDSTGGDFPDIGGEWIVWSQWNVDNTDIFAYNARTKERVQVTDDPVNEDVPRISGDLLCWSQGSAPDADIHGYSLSDRAVFAVSEDPADERLIGVDGTNVAFARLYHHFTDEPASYHYAWNLFLYDHATGILTNVTNFLYNPDHQPMGTVYPDEADFGGGVLVWREGTLVWNHPDSANQWSVRDSKTMRMLAGQNPTQLPTGGYHLSTNDWRIVWHQSDDSPSRYHQVFVWENDAVAQLTSEPVQHGRDTLATGGGFVVYDKWDPMGVYFRRVGVAAEFQMLSGQSLQDLRLDRNGAVWPSANGQAQFHIYYAFLQQPDIAVASADMTVSAHAPDEGDSIDVSIIVKNLTDYAQSDDITVQLLSGDPTARATQLASDRVIEGGLAGKAETMVMFTDIDVPDNPGGESQFALELCVHISTPSFDNPDNNLAKILIKVHDDDTDVPVLGPVTIAAHNGDGDGYIEDDEQVIISWTLADASGIGETTCSIDGVSREVTGTYQALAGPLAAGTHTVEITATDADDSPESMEPWTGSFTVYSHAPTVLSISPVHGTTEAARLLPIEATFDGPVSASSVTTGAIAVTAPDGTDVPGTVSYSAIQQKMTFLPTGLLQYSTLYTVTLTAGAGGVTDPIGNHLEADCVWSFTTLADVTPPIAEITSPADGDLLLTQTSILGTAGDDNFQNYRIEYQGSGDDWVEIAAGTTPVQSGTLAIWDIGDVPDGQYTLRLTVTDNAAPTPLVTEDSVQVVIDKNPPGVPDAPFPADGETDVSVNTVLDWEDSERAASYDLYIWQSLYGKPDTPAVSGLAASQYASSSSLLFGTTYNWQVVAANIIGDTYGPVWQFTTYADDDDLPDTWEQCIVDADPFDNIVSVADVLGEDDFDDDGLTNAEEFTLGTDATDVDSDSDGMADGWEVLNHLDPMNADDAGADPDGDGSTNLEEHDSGTNPWGRPLDIGWNLVSFVLECEIPDSEHVDGPMWYWGKGSYHALQDTREDDVCPVKPWRGYWLYIDTLCEIDIRTGQVSGLPDVR